MNAAIIPKQQLLPALLGLRAVAAIAVLLYHLVHLVKLPLPPSCGFVGTHFGLGVKLFFVLSGFSLCHSTCHTLGRENWIRDYALKRLFRIAPLFYAMLLVWVVFFRLRGVSTDFSTLALNLSFTYNLVPGKHESLVAAGWTIGVEMLFYCLLPVLLATVQNLRAAIGLFVGAAVAAATVSYALIEVPGIRVGRWLIGRRPAGGSVHGGPLTAAGPPTDLGGSTTAPR